MTRQERIGTSEKIAYSLFVRHIGARLFAPRLRQVKTRPGYTLPVEIPPILLGTSSFTAAGWEESFYPKGMRSPDYLSFYATRFHTVEVDSPFFSRSVFRDRHEFLDRLVPFLKKLPAAYKFAIEIRNRAWLDAEFANLLRDHNIALVLRDRFWMPSPSELNFDPITADWTYIRWLGDRKSIEEQTTTWNKTVIDRTQELHSWTDFCYQTRRRGVMIYAYANNHYSGHAPATIEQFRKLWQAKGFPELTKPRRSHGQDLLFPV